MELAIANCKISNWSFVIEISRLLFEIRRANLFDFCSDVSKNRRLITYNCCSKTTNKQTFKLFLLFDFLVILHNLGRISKQ